MDTILLISLTRTVAADIVGNKVLGTLLDRLGFIVKTIVGEIL